MTRLRVVFWLAILIHSLVYLVGMEFVFREIDGDLNHILGAIYLMAGCLLVGLGIPAVAWFGTLKANGATDLDDLDRRGFVFALPFIGLILLAVGPAVLLVGIIAGFLAGVIGDFYRLYNWLHDRIEKLHSVHTGGGQDDSNPYRSPGSF